MSAVMILLTAEEAEVAIEAIEALLLEGTPFARGPDLDTVVLQRVAGSLRMQLDKAEREQ